MVGHVELARTARAHALRAAAMSWGALTAMLVAIMLAPHGWFDFVLPFGGVAVVPVAVVLAALVVFLMPLERIGDVIVADVLGQHAHGRLQNIAEEISIAIGEAPGRVIVHDSTIPNVAAFPTAGGGVVLATSAAVTQLRRDELEALVAAQLAGMRDRSCRLATRAELGWGLTKILGLVSFVVAMPFAMFIGAGMVFAPRMVEATRDLCADVAAVTSTRHPAALAGALRHLARAAPNCSEQRLVKRWYLPINPFLVLPKRAPGTTSIGRDGEPGRSWTHAEEVAAELHLRADRAEALAAGADPRRFTGREYRRRWSQLGR